MDVPCDPTTEDGSLEQHSEGPGNETDGNVVVVSLTDCSTEVLMMIESADASQPSQHLISELDRPGQDQEGSSEQLVEEDPGKTEVTPLTDDPTAETTAPEENEDEPTESHEETRSSPEKMNDACDGKEIHLGTAGEAEDEELRLGGRNRGGRGYQENRRGKKVQGEKTRCDKTNSSSDLTTASTDSSISSDVSAPKMQQLHEVAALVVVDEERKAKGDDVQGGPTTKQDERVGLVARNKETHKPAEDGDKPKTQSLSVDHNKGGEDLLNLLKQAPKQEKRKIGGREDRGRGGGVPSRELKDKGRSAAELEAQWKKEAEQCRSKEEEKLQQEAEQRQKEEEQRQREEEEERRIKEEEMKSLDDFIKEANERIEWKTKLREENLKSAECRPDESFFFKLDSNLKKNTAFVKKLRVLTESQKDSLIKDLNSLNLTKYVGEAACAIVEAKLKMTDIMCALIICSLLHQRYADFSSSLLENWHKVLLTKKDDKVPNPSKLRVDLRLFADLVAVGVFTEKEGLPVLANQLTLLTSNDKDEHNNLTIIISFCKHCGDDYAGIISQKFRLLGEKHKKEIPRSQVLRGDRQKACRNLLKDYYSSLCKHLLQDCKEVRNMEKQNRRVLQTKGELSTERKEKFESAQQSFQKLLANATTLADVLDEDLPPLPEDELKADSETCGLDIFNPTKGLEFPADGADFGVFEDEDTRQFYESLPDLKAIVPGILYKDSEQATVIVAAEPITSVDDDLEGFEAEELEMMNDVDDKTLSSDSGSAAAAAAAEKSSNGKVTAKVVVKKDGKKEEEAEEEEKENPLLTPDVEVEDETDVGGSMKALIESYINNLPKCVNRELIDKAAIDFCMNLNTKTNRRKLVRALFLVHRTRYDLLPFYGRLVAMLNPCMPNVSIDLASMLKSDFKWHVRKKDQINIESKLKTVRFIGELVKFNMFSKNEVLHCLKMLISDFIHHNIEMACSLLESCGRFLYRNQESHHRMKVYLDVMMRKKAALHLDSRYSTMIENAYYYSNPPESKAEAKKERPPMHDYIRRLLYKDLNKTTIEKVLRQIRKLNWDDAENHSYITHCLMAVWNVRYSCIHCCANLLAGLVPYQELVGIQVVDGVLEDIRLGMEVNHPKYNQRRISIVKYLGELYNYRLVESQVVFRTLYSFISFGVSMEDSVSSVLDPPEHCFRIRLVCILLDTCGQYFDRGSSKKKLDCFLIYFQRYFWFKKKNALWIDEHPFPMEIEYVFHDTLELLRPKLKLYSNSEEASQAAEELNKEYQTKYAEMMKPLNQSDSSGNAASSLATIRESEEQEQLTQMTGGTGTQESDPDMEIDERGEQGTQSPSQSQSQKDGNDEDDNAVIGHSDEQRDDEDESGAEDELIDSAGEDLDDEKVTVITGGPKYIRCQEDDDFMAAFDKMMLETIQGRAQETVKVPVVEIAVPVTTKTQTKVKPPVLNILSSSVTSAEAAFSTGADSQSQEDYRDTSIAFTLLTKKGNKQQFATLNVPVTASFAAKFREQKEAEKAEKEQMKRVVLDIHERQEEEDYQEMLALLNRPLPSTNINRDRRVPYQHPKGAPDADAIFGSKKR